jgi:hypothetical protein
MLFDIQIKIDFFIKHYFPSIFCFIDHLYRVAIIEFIGVIVKAQIQIMFISFDHWVDIECDGLLDQIVF